MHHELLIASILTCIIVDTRYTEYICTADLLHIKLHDYVSIDALEVRENVGKLVAWEAIGELESVDVHQLKNGFRKHELDARVAEKVSI